MDRLSQANTIKRPVKCSKMYQARIRTVRDFLWKFTYKAEIDQEQRNPPLVGILEKKISSAESKVQSGEKGMQSKSVIG